jgi:Nitroreductase
MNDITSVIRSRRSIRKFKPGVEIPKEHIHLMLEAAMMPPSACNSRPWEFVVVETPAIREKIANAHPYAKMLHNASLAIVVCALNDAQEGIATGFWPQDCGASVENLLLQAVGLGYGTCWCGLYPNEKIIQPMKDILGVQSMPVALVVIGEADEEPKARGFYDETKVKYL